MISALQCKTLANELVALQALAEVEQKVHGHVTPQTLVRIVETLARTEAIIVIDDAKEKARGGV